jgi:hypothetical protein
MAYFGPRAAAALTLEPLRDMAPGLRNGAVSEARVTLDA